MFPECGPAIPLWPLPSEEEKATKDWRAAEVDSAVAELLAQCGMGEEEGGEDDEAALESIAIASLERRMGKTLVRARKIHAKKRRRGNKQKTNEQTK